LYVRVTLRNQLNLKKSDLLHFLPFLISLIDYLPFYLLPIAEKKVIVANFLTHYSDSYLKNYGFIPSDYHFLARGVLGGIYCVLMFRLIRNRKEILPNNKLNYYFPKQINEVTNWLRTLTLGMVFIYMSYFISVVFIEIDGGFDKLITPIGITLLITSLTILSLAIQIFLHPNVLYGIPEIAIEDEVSIEKTNKELNKIKSTESESGFDWINFESKLKLEAPFTRAGITLNEMASLYNLSPRNLSFLVKNYTGFGFQDYLNKLRIDYVLLMLKENKHQEQTLESLGSEAGFGSKSAFFYSFKKNMGCTPKEYLQKESI
jgi:AraC-like DNA-binding protein